MPKRFKFSNKETKQFILENHNSTIKIKNKGNFITPKRAEGHENDDLSQNYSQAPTPVPQYRYKSSIKERKSMFYDVLNFTCNYRKHRR